MLITVYAMARLVRVLARALAEPASRGVVATGGLTLIAGVAFYSLVEGWGVVDALYFCVITLATIGYGDIAPVTDAGKLFTVAYSLLGIGILTSLIATLGVATVDRADEWRRPLRPGVGRRAGGHDGPADETS